MTACMLSQSTYFETVAPAHQRANWDFSSTFPFKNRLGNFQRPVMFCYSTDCQCRGCLKYTSVDSGVEKFSFVRLLDVV
jgi:hypothetical protein